MLVTLELYYLLVMELVRSETLKNFSVVNFSFIVFNQIMMSAQSAKSLLLNCEICNNCKS